MNEVLTAPELWAERVRATPDAPFLTYDDLHWTFGEFDRSVKAAATRLVTVGVDTGGHVALLLPNSPEMLRVEVAVLTLGAVLVPILPSSTNSEIEYVLMHSDAEILVTVADKLELLGDWKARFPALKYVVLLDEVPAGSAAEVCGLYSFDASALPNDGMPDPQDPAAILYTSGSTGRPKGVLISQAGFVTSGRYTSRRLELRDTDRVLVAIPLCHAAGLMMCGLSLCVNSGSAMTLVERFSASKFWDTVKRNSITHTFLFPAMSAILRVQPLSDSDRDNSLRLVWSHMADPEFSERFGVQLCVAWGASETSAMGSLSGPREVDFPSGYVGRKWPETAQVAAFDPQTLNRLPSGVIGELWFSHPDVMLGYYKDPVQTLSTLVDGWVRSGDLGSVTDDDRVFYAGRLKNVIKRSGENVSGEEIESVLTMHQDVTDAVVFGVPDPIRTEEVFAVVAIRDEAIVGPEEVVAWCRRTLSEWKVPRYVSINSGQLHRLQNNKVDRQRVIADARAVRAWDKETMGNPVVPYGGPTRPVGRHSQTIATEFDEHRNHWGV